MTPAGHPGPRTRDRHVGGCMQPVLLPGHVDHIHGATGELLHRYTTVHAPAALHPGAARSTPHAPALWRRSTAALRRALPPHAGISRPALAGPLPVSFPKAAEYQRRGVVHFHAVIRLDGPDGPHTPPPSWATPSLLTVAIGHATRAVRVPTPAANLPARTLVWGREHDTRPIAATGNLSDNKVAGYIAKSATKAAECPGTLDRRTTPTDRLADLPSAATPAASSPKACASANSPNSTTSASVPGHTCSASTATSPPKAVPTPPPSANCAPPEPTTSTSTPWPADICPLPLTACSSSAPGTSPAAATPAPTCLQPYSPAHPPQPALPTRGDQPCIR